MRNILTTIIILNLMIKANASDYYVDRNTSNPPGNGSQENPWVTISYALAQISGTNHNVYVAGGIYNTQSDSHGWYEIFPINMKDGISLFGEGQEVTIIDADSTNTVISCVGVESNTTLAGFTITGGNSFSGGGIYCSQSSLLIENNIITHNYGSEGAGIYCGSTSNALIRNNIISYNEDNDEVGWNGLGGGIHVSSSSPVILENIIEGNIIRGNYAEGLWHIGGGGIVSEGSSPVIIHNTINSNGSKYGPGGLDFSGSSSAILSHNLIIRNIAERSTSIYGGGAIRCNSSLTIENNTIVSNNGQIRGGIFCYNNSDPVIKNNILSNNSGYAIFEGDTTSDPQVYYNLFHDNSTGLYYNEGQSEFTTLMIMEALISECANNLEGAPLFVDTTNDNYHLLTGSPAIDQGDPNSPSDPDGTRADIGALYFPQEGFLVSVSIKQGEQSGDININYSIINSNSTEVSLLCEYKAPSASEWKVASVTGDTSQLAPGNYDGLVTWHSTVDLPAMDIENLMFRITPKDTEIGLPDTVIFHLDNNEPPSVKVSDPAGEQEGDVTLDYNLSDSENDTLSILCEYYDDFTSGWVKASITGDTTGITSIEGSITWNTMADLPTTAAYIKFRITPRDLDMGTSDTTEFILDNIGVSTLTINTQLTGEQTGDILFEYTISDDEKDIISLTPEYSTDGGETWHDASITGNTGGIDSLHYTGSLVWHSDTDLPGADLLTVRFRIVPDDGTIGISSETNNFHLDNNSVPSVVLDNKYEVHNRDITIKYSLYDSEYDTLSIFAEYYESSTYAFIRAAITGDTVGIDSSEYSGSIVWKSSDNLPDFSDTVIFRVTVMDMDTGLSDTLRILPLLSVNITAGRYSICEDESLELNAVPEGGTGTYEYSWTSDPSGFSSTISNPVVLPEISTSYTVVVDDGENTASKSVTITVNALPVFEISGEDELCAYQSGEHYIVENNADYKYNWNIAGGDIISGGGSNELTVNWGSQGEGSKVSLTVTDSETGCTLTEDYIINILPIPEKPEIMLKGQHLLICSDSGMFSYQWYKDDLLIENQTRQFYYVDDPDLSASYYVEAILENTCRTMSNPFQLNTKSSEDKGFSNNIGSSLIIYPNPNEGIFNLVIINEINAQVKILIRDNYGRILKYIEADKQSAYLSTDINIIDFINGIYLIEVTFDNETYLRKIILNK